MEHFLLTIFHDLAHPLVVKLITFTAQDASTVLTCATPSRTKHASIRLDLILLDRFFHAFEPSCILFHVFALGCHGLIAHLLGEFLLLDKGLGMELETAGSQ